MKVYLAASSKENERQIAKRRMEELDSAGHAIALDWTRDVGREGTMSKLELERRASEAIDAVCCSDVLVALINMTGRIPGCSTATGAISDGGLMEIGMAIASRIPVIVCEEDAFFFHFFFHSKWVYTVSTFLEVMSILEVWNKVLKQRGGKWKTPPKDPRLSSIFLRVM